MGYRWTWDARSSTTCLGGNWKLSCCVWILEVVFEREVERERERGRESDTNAQQKVEGAV